LFGGFIIL